MDVSYDGDFCDEPTRSLEHAINWTFDASEALEDVIGYAHRADKLWLELIGPLRLWRGYWYGGLLQHAGSFIQANVATLKPYPNAPTTCVCAFEAAPWVFHEVLGHPPHSQAMRRLVAVAYYDEPVELERDWRTILLQIDSAKGPWQGVDVEPEFDEDDWEKVQLEIMARIASTGEAFLKEFCCDLRIEAIRTEAMFATNQESCANGSRDSKPRWTRHSANPVVAAYLSEHPDASLSAISEATGIKVGTIRNTGAWQVVKRARATFANTRPATVPITSELERMLSASDPADALARLIAEQEADREPSPLDKVAHAPRSFPRV